MEPKFLIFVETVEGNIIQAFSWCRDAASGVARAWKDAELFEVRVDRVWAEPVNMK